MATLAETLKSGLLADATLTALLPGGVVDAEDLPYDGGGVRSVPRLPDGVVAATFALIRWRSSNATGPSAVQGELAFLEIYAYQDTGYAEVEAAMTRMKSLRLALRMMRGKSCNWVTSTDHLTRGAASDGSGS